MAEHEGITVFEGKNGKQRYQARVWYERKFITSRTFDSLALAREFRKRKLEEAIKGTALPASERRKQRKLEADLDRSMRDWASLYIEANARKLDTNPSKHGKSRLLEYELVGRLLGGLTMRDFSGQTGGELIEKLTDDWRFMHFVRGSKAGAPAHIPGKPIADQTLRLRLSALDRLIAHAMGKLPKELNYVGPQKPEDYVLPPAHSRKRERLPSLDEFAALLKHFGTDSDMGEFLRVIDETGCRLSEIGTLHGNRVEFHGADGHVLGGTLTLQQHKTSKHTGPRKVPLSRYAAQVLQARKTRFGDGLLFPDLPGAAAEIGKAFDKACTALKIEGLQIKDFRREFITRNLRTVPALELMRVHGQTSCIDLNQLSMAERRTIASVGHTRVKTALGYVTPELESMAQAFTANSRWPAVTTLLDPSSQVAASREEAAALEREMGELLARMRKLGMTTATA